MLDGNETHEIKQLREHFFDKCNATDKKPSIDYASRDDVTHKVVTEAGHECIVIQDHDAALKKVTPESVDAVMKDLEKRAEQSKKD